jgi:hypothetical protein
MGWVESWATSGGETGESNRITLLHDASGDGIPRSQSVFPDHLRSPLGMALVGNDLYVAIPIFRYPYKEGDTKITDRGDHTHRIARRPHRSSLDQEPSRLSRWFAAVCRRRIQQQHHGEWHRSRTRPCCDMAG